MAFRAGLRTLNRSVAGGKGVGVPDLYFKLHALQ